MPATFLPDVPGPALIAMLHVPALPGTPRHRLAMDGILAQVTREAEIYAEAGVDAVMLENMHDVPYLRTAVGPEITASMAVVAERVVDVVSRPVGIQILAGANEPALAVAATAGLQFVRVEGFVFGHVADEGWLDACAGELLRYRRRIGAENVAVLADIKKKHSAHAVTADVSLAETARAAVFAGADGVIVTGAATGEVTDPADLDQVRSACDRPLLVGSGVTVDNLSAFAAADALIVGSHFKEGGRWDNPLDPDRLAAFMARLEELRTAG